MVIDFVEIKFNTVIKTNGASVKKNAGLVYAYAWDKGPGGAASEFTSRIYDVENWFQVEAAIKRISKQYDLADPPVITKVEISLDAYSKNNSSDELIEHTVHFLWLLKNPVSSNRRFSEGRPGSAQGLSSRSYNLLRLKRGGTFYIGSQKHDSKSQRIYFKQTDRGQAISDSNKHRARIEITLQHTACPFATVDEAKAFKFESLAPYFSFRAIRDGMKPFDDMLADTNPIVGERKSWTRKGRRGRQFSRLTISNIELNAIVYEKLRHLTKRLNSRRVSKFR